MKHTEVKLKFVLFSPSKPIKSPILLIESGRKIESRDRILVELEFGSL